MNPYPSLRRVPRAVYLIVALSLYLLLLWLGGKEDAVHELPGRELYSKVYHVVFYAGWCALAWLSMRRPTLPAAVGLTTLAGAGDELHQYFLPFRQGRLDDVMLDAAAALLMALLLRALHERSRARQDAC